MIHQGRSVINRIQYYWCITNLLLALRYGFNITTVVF